MGRFHGYERWIAAGRPGRMARWNDAEEALRLVADGAHCDMIVIGGDRARAASAASSVAIPAPTQSARRQIEIPFSTAQRQPGPKRMYFAYGSNMWAPQMKMRCPTAASVGAAVIHGWRLTFAGDGGIRWGGGGVATIVRDERHQVAGRLWLMEDEDLTRLDRFEGHPRVYERMRIDVALARKNGETKRAWVYVMPLPDHGSGGGQMPFRAPSPKYFGQIQEAYRVLGFDREDLVAAAYPKRGQLLLLDGGKRGDAGSPRAKAGRHG